jgi:tetratricopeptide (TPR) repeat protein
MVDFYENRVASCLAGLRKAVNLDPDEPDYVFNLGQAAARNERYKEAADAYERFLLIAPKTDADRPRSHYWADRFPSLPWTTGCALRRSGSPRTSIAFESFDKSTILSIRINGDKQPLKFVLDTGSGMSVISDLTARKIGLKTVARGGMARAVGGRWQV